MGEGQQVEEKIMEELESIERTFGVDARKEVEKIARNKGLFVGGNS